MDASSGAIVDWIRRPEYTGENRCFPCTVVNVALSVALGAAVGVAVAPAAGAVATALGLGAVWLRGYLVPGTPEFTKRYLPGRALALFGKAPAATGAAASTSGPESVGGVDVDPQAYLLDAGALVETDDGTDLTYAPRFASAWRAAVGEEVVASCWSTRDVVVGRCEGCDARVFELEPAVLDGVE